MALQDSNIWSGNFTFRDRDSNTASTSIYLPGAMLYGAASVEFALIAGALGALSDAELTKITISRRFEDPDLLVNGAGPSSDVERKGAFVFMDAQRKPFTITVPSLKYGLVNEGSNRINRLDPATIALIAMVLANGRTYRDLDVVRFHEAEKRHTRNPDG